MRSLIAISVLTLTIGGCQSIASGTTSALTPIVQTSILSIQEAAKARCATVPTSEAVTALLHAAAGTVNVNDIATAACVAFNAYSTYRAAQTAPARSASLDGAPAADLDPGYQDSYVALKRRGRAPLPPSRPDRPAPVGSTVSGTAVINGKPVPVTGTVVR